MFVVHWVMEHFQDSFKFDERFDKSVKFEWKEYANIVKDIISEYNYVFTKTDRVNMSEYKSTHITFDKIDSVPMDDVIFKSYNYYDPDLGLIPLP